MAAIATAAGFSQDIQPKDGQEKNTMTLRIMPVGDSITRGTYLAPSMIPNPDGGGWRKSLQDKLRAAGYKYDFVGELNYGAFGHDGVIDPAFDPDHHGLAGFSNSGILNGGVVPTDDAVLTSMKVKEVRVPDIVTVLKKHKPNVVLLMSGANGFDAAARDRLIKTIADNFTGHLFVATITPQKPPRSGAANVTAYNQSLANTVAALQAAGKSVHFVDMHAALTPEDIMEDGVHPTRAGMEKMAAAWYDAIRLVFKPE